MAETKIEWTGTPRPDGTIAPGYTFNPWIGCTKVSPGCDHCYAEAGTNHRVSKGKGLPLWGEQAHRQVTSAAYWRQPLKWDREAAAGERRKVFPSLCDPFEDLNSPLNGGPLINGGCLETLDDVRAHLWRLIEATPNLDWLLLTKRPQNVLRMVPARWTNRLVGEDGVARDLWPRNVWIGTTVEDQPRAEERLDTLLRVPAAVRFVSYEPALGPVDFRPWLPGTGKCRRCSECMGADHHWLGDCDERGMPFWGCKHCDATAPYNPDTYDGFPRTNAPPPGIDWLIVGGESGPHARPFDLAWARAAVAQCKAAGVPVFVKQMGARPQADTRDEANEDFFDQSGLSEIDVTDAGWPYFGEGYWPLCLRDKKGGDPAEWPADLRVREWPYWHDPSPASRGAMSKIVTPEELQALVERHAREEAAYNEYGPNSRYPYHVDRGVLLDLLRRVPPLVIQVVPASEHLEPWMCLACWERASEAAAVTHAPDCPAPLLDSLRP